ncbi:MAG: hypothetical protein QNJ54_37185 [Prochloraceae cyanobacterium]|nr:hypothetical protein [Prochloraceae cyanobacterium]
MQQTDGRSLWPFQDILCLPLMRGVRFHKFIGSIVVRLTLMHWILGEFPRFQAWRGCQLNEG